MYTMNTSMTTFNLSTSFVPSILENKTHFFKLLSTCFILSVGTLQSQAQSIDCQMVATEASCDEELYCFNLQLKGNNGADYMGSASIRYSYDASVLAFSGNSYNGITTGCYQSLNFDNEQGNLHPECSSGGGGQDFNPYRAHSYDGNTPGDFLLTLVLDYPTTIIGNDTFRYSCPSIGGNWVDVGLICFEVLNPNGNPNIAIMGSQNGVAQETGSSFNSDTDNPEDKFENGSFPKWEMSFNAYQESTVSCSIAPNWVNLDDPGANIPSFQCSEDNAGLFVPYSIIGGADWYYVSTTAGSVNNSAVQAEVTEYLYLSIAELENINEDFSLSFVSADDPDCGTSILFELDWLPDPLSEFCFQEVLGCVDPQACNYDAVANTDDGSCQYAFTWYQDTDGDGLGNPNETTLACTQPAGYVFNGNDADDTCDGVTDECGVCNGPGAYVWYQDADGDGLGNPNTSVLACTQPSGYVFNGDDADDTCDGVTDECGVCNGPGAYVWYQDADGDGLGNPNASLLACTQPLGYVANSNDTDDACDGVFDECGVCNGAGAFTWYQDSDGDGLGNPNASITSCTQPLGYVYNADDTNDNCNGILDECGICNGPGASIWYQDADSDGLGNPNASITSCTQPLGYVANSNDTDDECDGVLDECGVCNGLGPSTWYQDADGDGLGNFNASITACLQPLGYVDNGNDLNDECDGVVDECGVCNGLGIPTGICDCEGNEPSVWYEDADGDGLGDLYVDSLSCDQPDGYVSGFESVGIQDEAYVFDAMIYPNPAQSTLFVELDSQIDTEISIEILDLSGRLIQQISTKIFLGNNDLQLDLLSYNSGIYFLQIKTAEKQFINKFVVE